MLAGIEGDIALIEVGASAGLCLYPDRYAYSYDGQKVGSSTLHISVDTGGTVPIPPRVPSVSWRAGLDLNPLDVTNDDDLAWLRACIWPEHDERRRRLDVAASIVADDPPRITRGDLSDATLAMIDAAPSESTKVVFHSAVLAYVDEASRLDFAATMRDQVDRRDDLIWLSNEGTPVIAGLETPDRPVEHPAGAPFHLGRDGIDVLAITDPHGRWLCWIPPRSSPR